MTTHPKNFQISKTIRSSLPLNRLLFASIKNKIMGDKYDLSLVFIGDLLSKKMNLKHRKKNKYANILSFPLSNSQGEIFINIPMAKREYKKYHMKFEKFIIFLFIHGLLHLKGMEHSSKMERLEQKFLKNLCPKIYQ